MLYSCVNNNLYVKINEKYEVTQNKKSLIFFYILRIFKYKTYENIEKFHGICSQDMHKFIIGILC